jgi:hypothetical protein
VRPAHSDDMNSATFTGHTPDHRAVPQDADE